MSSQRRPNSLRAILALDEKVDTARTVLQQTSDAHPAFERRVEALVRLLEKRDVLCGEVARGETGSEPPRPRCAG
jgi:hypothetical protein